MSRAVASIAGFAGLMVASTAFAAPVLESESNNTFATANFLTAAQQAAFGGSNAFVFDGVLTGGGAGAAADVDWMSFDLPVGGYLTLGLFGIPTSLVGDPIMGLFDASGSWIAANDDDNIGLFPAIEATLPAGRYYVAIALFGDASTSSASLPSAWDGLDAAGAPVTGQTIQYKLTVGFNAIPTPGAAALLGLGGLVAGRRRR